MVALVTSNIKNLPKKCWFCINECDAKFNFKFMALSLDKKNIFLWTVPFLPIELINIFTLQKFKLKFSQKAPLGKLRNNWLWIQAMDTICEVMVRQALPLWNKNYLFCNYGRISLEYRSQNLKVLSYSSDFLRRSCINKQLPLLFERSRSQKTKLVSWDLSIRCPILRDI